MKNTKSLLVLPRLQAERMNPDAEWACISITNPKQQPAALDGGAAVLRQGFYDAEHELDSFETMTDEHARELLEFVQQHQDRNILVHCEQGRSRSMAVAAFLSGWLDRKVCVDMNLANRLVLRRLHVAGFRYALKHFHLRRAAYCAGLLDYPAS